MSQLSDIDEVVQLRAVLLDEKAEELVRDKAAHRLGQIASGAAIDALVAALDVGGAGVRWAVADGLARVGRPALEPILCKLQLSRGGAPLYAAIHHVLKQLPLPPEDRQAVKAVLKALEGSGAEATAPMTAAKVRGELQRGSARAIA